MWTAAFAARRAIRRSRRRTRNYDKPRPEKSDLVNCVGEFLVCETGINARLAPPLSSLSRHYPWAWVTPGIAALRLAVLGEGSTSSLIYTKMSRGQVALLEQRLGEVHWTYDEQRWCFDHDSDLVDAIGEIWDWLPKVVGACPYQSVVHDIQHARKLSDADLDRYVMGRMMS